MPNRKFQKDMTKIEVFSGLNVFSHLNEFEGSQAIQDRNTTAPIWDNFSGILVLGSENIDILLIFGAKFWNFVP